MIDMILIFWILIFIVFLIVNLLGESTTFGMIAAFWILLLGLAIIITGIQVQTGVEVTDVGDTQTIVYTYTDATVPYGSFSFIWGIVFIAISMYMLLANARARTT